MSIKKIPRNLTLLLRSNKMMMMGFLFMLLFFVTTSVTSARGSPSDEMQKFIDECDYMVEQMNHCAEGWVELEQQIISSIDSFADKIVYTESLIMEETELILDMADRIVQTEEIMIDLVESCDCDEERNVSKPVKYVIPSSFRKLPTRASLFEDPGQVAIAGVEPYDTCSAMDSIIEVMDACIDAFVVYNDDFIEFLSYMDYAIEDMGARIVDTECLIVNMSYQIGDMADLIVETEELMADMAASCCRGGSEGNLQGHKDIVPLKKTSFLKTGDDDLLLHCEFPEISGFEQHQRFNVTHARTLINEANLKITKFTKSWAVLNFLPLRKSYIRSTLLPALSVASPPEDVMPCETWWNPFCCAAEVCADMMVEMIEMMASGADWMLEICEDCIDEVGKLADDIVKTEENIILMGYAINDMAEYIVVFIDEGLEFMALFCPSTQKTYALRGKFQTKKDGRNVENLVKSDHNVSLKTLSKHITNFHNITFVLEPLSKDVSHAVAGRQALAGKVKMMQQIHSYYKNVHENPFGEFAAMVDAMMEVMTVFTNMFAEQTRLMTEMFEDLVAFAAEEAKFAGMVVDMGNDVARMGEDVENECELMTELSDDCL